ncbi:MAG: DUF1295 domain-containing protein [Proteobacteria bacterium]|nr:DUF1295 domain-containing protein [Pseudomonadota bacterium]
MNETVYRVLLVFIFAMSALTFASSMKRVTRYGRYMKDHQKNTLPALWGWLLFESPQVVAFALCFWLTAESPSVVAIGIFCVWQAHYVHRAVLFPLRLNNRHKRFPVGGVLAGLVFNSINGVLNGWAVAHAAHLDSTTWLTDPRFVVGAAIMAVGWGINFHSDNTLIGLRSDGFKGYRIPTGGLFTYVSAANYFGEIVMWTGFALMTWTAAGLAFAVFTVANLLPRGLAHHRWYLKTFDDYPPERRAILPGLL